MPRANRGRSPKSYVPARTEQKPAPVKVTYAPCPDCKARHNRKEPCPR